MNYSPSIQAADALKRQHLFPFVARAFEELHPGESFLSSPYVDAMCDALQRVAEGTCRRLLITVPPRYGKSITASVAFAAWILGRDPSCKIIVASYGQDLAQKHARDFRAVVSAPFFQELFPACEVASDRLDEMVTTEGGGRKAVSVGGPATGFGADIIIVDDLLKAADAASPTEREKAKDYYTQTLLSRLNDKKTGRIIVVQQRLHEDDLPGKLIADGNFLHLNLPAIAVENEDIPLSLGMTWCRKEGEALCPEREDLDTLEQIRHEMGHAAFAAQYQQDPTPVGGNRLRWNWFGIYEGEIDPKDAHTHVVQSWDVAITEEPTSDYSVGTTWVLNDNDWYLADLIRERLAFPDLKRRIQSNIKKWRARRVLVESSGIGVGLLQQLHADEPNGRRRTMCQLYEGVTPRESKIERFEAQTARLETGRYWLPAEAPWLRDLKKELLAFPKGKHDDQVDSVIQFVKWSSGRGGRDFNNRDIVTGRPLRNFR